MSGRRKTRVRLKVKAAGSWWVGGLTQQCTQRRATGIKPFISQFGAPRPIINHCPGENHKSRGSRWELRQLPGGAAEEVQVAGWVLRCKVEWSTHFRVWAPPADGVDGGQFL